MKALSSEEWKRLFDALDTALELSPADREPWLRRIAAQDAGFAAQLGGLLAARERIETDAFLHAPLQLPQIATDADGGASDPLPGEPVAGQRIGPYRLLRELGAGGMGLVWLAERADGLFKRPVALKLPHAGAHARVFAERFAREREILAALDHPHVARLYDAGIDADGQPFIALEYVEGEPLTAYCDRKQLDIGKRIALFLDVLQAVQYAHERLVVHRDLKPANILVTEPGKVKLLDFGIARLLADEAADETALTQIGGRAMTPDYASPEQILGGPIGVASDVYSLGVLLYELLVGKRPYKLQRESRGALEDAIVAVEAGRPSDDAIEPQTAQRRASTPERLRRILRGDLDTIVRTALAKSPAARYATAAAFAEDLQRYLDGRPVLARPESRLYRMRKFLVRNRWPVAAASMLLAIIVAAAVVANVQAGKARAEAAKANAIRQFVVGVFENNSSAQSDPEKARATTARQLLDLGRDELLRRPAGEPEVAEALLATFSEMYFQLGLSDEALQLDRARLALNRKFFGDLDPRTLDAQRNVGEALLNQGAELDEALAIARDVIAKLDRIGDRDSLVRAQSHVLLAEALANKGDEASFEHHLRAVELMRSRYRDHHDFPAILGNFARAEAARGDLASARASIVQAVEAWSQAPKRLGTIGAYLYGIAAQIHEANDDLRATEAALREALKLERSFYGADSWQRHLGWVRLGRLLNRTGRAAEVLEVAPDALARLNAASEVPQWFQARVLALVLEADVEVSDAPAMSLHAAALQRLGCDQGDALTDGWCRDALLRTYLARGDTAASARVLKEIESGQRPSPARRPVSFAAANSIDALTSIARAHLARGSTEKAAAAIDQARRQFAAMSVQSLLIDLRLGAVERSVLLTSGRAEEARRLAARLQQRLASHPDRELLKSYEADLAAAPAAVR